MMRVVMSSISQIRIDSVLHAGIFRKRVIWRMWHAGVPYGCQVVGFVPVSRIAMLVIECRVKPAKSNF